MDEEYVDQEANIAAKDSAHLRHAATGPDLEWIFAQRNGGAFRGGPKTEIKQWSEIVNRKKLQEQKGQGKRLTAPREAGTHSKDISEGGRCLKRALTRTLPTMVNQNRRFPHVFTSATCMICGMAAEILIHWLRRCPCPERRRINLETSKKI